ncbi:MAG: acyltransferase [Winogradskyella sp.]
MKVKFRRNVISIGRVNLGSGVKIVVEANAYIKFGDNVTIKNNTTIYAKKNSKITFGNNTSTGHDTEISANKSITIGSDVIMGANTYITDSNHGYSMTGIPFREQPMEIGSVEIGNNVWLGRNAMILKGSNVGSDTVVAAGAVVTKCFPENIILGGVPAKVIKSIYV